MVIGAGVGALIFDVDGVIVNSMPLHEESWRLYLQKYGLDADKLVERMHGKRNDEIVMDYFGRDLSPAEVCRHGAEKEALYRELMRPQFDRYLTPGLKAFLDSCPAIPMGVGSNAEPANVEFTLTAAGLQGRFQVIVDGHQVEHPKPAPDIYLRAAGRLGVAPSRCVIFEDSPGGVAAGLAAGSRVVLIQTTVDSLPGVSLAVKDFTAPELRAWLEAA